LADPFEIVNSLYGGFFVKGVRYFFPRAQLEIVRTLVEPQTDLRILHRPDGTLQLDWMDRCYRLAVPGRALSEHQMRLLGAIGGVLSARYRSIFFAVSAAATSSLFEGLVEDRYVSAFLDHFPYLDETAISAERDVLADAIEVLRQSSLITYENRRISTGVLLMGAASDPRPGPPRLPEGSLPYTSELISIKSFHRLCDGLKTLFLVNREGLLVDLVDVEEWSRNHDGMPLPVPNPARYDAHSRATLEGGSICLVLTPNGEIKVFAEGAQVFSFLEGRWHITDSAEKYREWKLAVGNAGLAELLFTTGLNLAEHRRGGLFLVLDDPARAVELVAPDDLLENGHTAPGKARIHYLLRGKKVVDLEPSVIESIARMDGGIVLDRDSTLRAFGAILRPCGPAHEARATEGGRTTAALNASHYGNVLKISEDGILSFYRNGREVWEI
jgi:hypothetical protein